jgi:hypothetical protein
LGALENLGKTLRDWLQTLHPSLRLLPASCMACWVTTATFTTPSKQSILSLALNLAPLSANYSIMFLCLGIK